MNETECEIDKFISYFLSYVMEGKYQELDIKLCLKRICPTNYTHWNVEECQYLYLLHDLNGDFFSFVNHFLEECFKIFEWKYFFFQIKREI